MVDDVVLRNPPITWHGIPTRKANERMDWGICMAIYGAAGTGKTTLAAQADDSEYGHPVLFLDAEGGSRSISDRTLDIVDVTTWRQIDRMTQEFVRSNDIPWKTIVIDNMSEIQNICLRNAVGSSDSVQIQHYGKATADMLLLTRAYRDLARVKGVNVILIAWDSPESDPETGVIKRDVGFTPSLARQFPGIIDIVGYLTSRNDPPVYTRELHFAQTPRTAAKLRRSRKEAIQTIPLVIPYTIDQPLMVDLLGTLRGDKPFPTETYIQVKGATK